MQSPTDVEGCTDDVVAGPDLDGHRLTGQHGRVDGRRAGDDNAVGRDLLAGSHHKHIVDRELADGNPFFGRTVPHHGDILGAQVQQGPQRRAGLSLRPRLEIAAGEDEGGDCGGDLEVQMRLAGRQ